VPSSSRLRLRTDPRADIRAEAGGERVQALDEPQFLPSQSHEASAVAPLERGNSGAVDRERLAAEPGHPLDLSRIVPGRSDGAQLCQGAFLDRLQLRKEREELAPLQESHDAGINADGNAKIVNADAGSYCAESTVGSATFHKSGPAGDILSGPALSGGAPGLRRSTLSRSRNRTAAHGSAPRCHAA
jgi:hypothetical protein